MTTRLRFYIIIWTLTNRFLGQ